MLCSCGLDYHGLGLLPSRSSSLPGAAPYRGRDKAVILTYLLLTNCRLGLLINFGEEYIRDGISRVVNGLPSDPKSERAIHFPERLCSCFYGLTLGLRVIPGISSSR